jgi:uncharacterized membrane protein
MKYEASPEYLKQVSVRDKIHSIISTSGIACLILALVLSIANAINAILQFTVIASSFLLIKDLSAPAPISLVQLVTSLASTAITIFIIIVILLGMGILLVLTSKLLAYIWKQNLRMDDLNHYE